jgi:hypothetical protein
MQFIAEKQSPLLVYSLSLYYLTATWKLRRWQILLVKEHILFNFLLYTHKLRHKIFLYFTVVYLQNSYKILRWILFIEFDLLSPFSSVETESWISRLDGSVFSFKIYGRAMCFTCTLIILALFMIFIDYYYHNYRCKSAECQKHISRKWSICKIKCQIKAR